MDIREDETLEDLQLRNLRIIQKKQGFRFGMEAVLLSDFARISQGDTVADLGCGNGILPLLLHGRDKGSRYYGFEKQEAAADLAKRNAALNRLEDRISIFHADVEKAPALLGDIRVDAVLSNPPWTGAGRGTRNPDPALSLARHREENTLDLFFSSAYRILRRRGRIFLVCPAGEILTVFRALSRSRLEPKRYQLVYPSPAHAARLLLTEAVRDGKPGLEPMEPLIVQNENGLLTNKLKSVYHIDKQTGVYSDQEAP